MAADASSTRRWSSAVARPASRSDTTCKQQGAIVRDPRRETSGRRQLARALGLASKLYSPASRDALPGHAVPGAVDRVPDHGRDGRLPRGVCGAIRAAGAPESASTLSRGGRPLRRDRRRTRFEAENVVVATGVFQKPHVPAFASELDPGITQLHSNDYRNLRNSRRAMCSSSAQATRAPTSPSRRRRAARGRPLGT